MDKAGVATTPAPRQSHSASKRRVDALLVPRQMWNVSDGTNTAASNFAACVRACVRA